MTKDQTVFDVLCDLVRSGDYSLRVGSVSDGLCSADGCSQSADHATLMGIPFCRSHYSAFYSPENVPLKAGVVYMQRETETP
jgi:hypothetical protein